MPYDERDEAALTTYISSALEVYLSDNQYQASYTASTAKQSLERLHEAEKFVDLVRRVTNSKVLALEIKVRKTTSSGHDLPSFREKQHNILNAVFAHKVPLHYAYNKIEEEDVANYKSRGVLKNINVSIPSEIDKKVKLYDKHGSLLSLVDSLVSGGDGDECKAAYFSKAFNQYSSAIGLRRMLIAYNIEESAVDIFDDEGLAAFGECIEEFMGVNLEFDFQGLVNKSSASKLKGKVKVFIDKFEECLNEKMNREVHREVPQFENEPPEDGGGSFRM